MCWQAFAQVLATNVVGPALLTGALYKQLRAAAKLAKAVRPVQRLSAAPAPRYPYAAVCTAGTRGKGRRPR